MSSNSDGESPRDNPPSYSEQPPKEEPARPVAVFKLAQSDDVPSLSSLQPNDHNPGLEVRDSKKLQRVAFNHSIDHTAHDVFVELDELCMDDDGVFEWKEKARWIKFEEDVELGGEWGKPHVSSLSFHSLLELRKLLEHGVMQFDLTENTLSGIVQRICQSLRDENVLDDEEVIEIERALLYKHRHKFEESNFRRVLSSTGVLQDYHTRNQSSASFNYNLHNTGGAMKKNFSEPAHPLGEISVPVDSPDVKFSLAKKRGSADSMDERERKTSVFNPTRKKSTVAHRVPLEAEAANVLVGNVNFLQQPVMVFARLAEGLMLEDVTEVEGMPVRFILILMGPTTVQMSTADYHEIGRAMSTLMSFKRFQQACYTASSSNDLIEAMNDFLDDSVVLPAGEWTKSNILPVLEDIKQQVETRNKKRRKTLDTSETERETGLERTGKWGLGLIQDVKRRYPLYWSDIRDACHPQCISVIIFIFFAILAPAITFGADIELDRTNHWMGPTETILGSSITGLLFALFAGQPLLIIGTTGPLAVFEGSLYDTAQMVGEEDYMALRLWVGIWIAVICAVTSVFELSYLLEYFTRFIEEIFAMLVSLIFIVSVVMNLIKIFQEHPLKLNDTCEVNFDFTPETSTCLDEGNCGLPWNNSTLGSYCCVSAGMEQKPNTALLSVTFAFGCFFIAYFLKIFRSTPFLGKHIRKGLGDFGVPLGIFIMTMVDVLLQDDAYTAKLSFPEKFAPTKQGYADSGFTRDWFISPSLERWWLAPVAIIPAFLLFFLVFIETQITARILNKPEHNLQKGTGYHLNILVIGLASLVSGVLGTPFVCAATVRSVTHTGALTVADKIHAPGEKPTLRVREQRVTAIAVQLLLGLSVLLKDVLAYVPTSVLYGVFLYMGISCLVSLQFYDRLKLWLLPRKHYPNIPYVRNVPGWKLHLFTFIQVAAVAVMWAVNESPASIFFPFFLMILVPIRLKLLPKIYSETELEALDAEKLPIGVEDDDTNIQVTAHMPY